MKNKFNLVMILILIVVTFTYFLFIKKQKNSNEDVGNLEKQEIIVGLDDAFPPIGFRDEKMQLIGFDVDFAKEAFKRIGKKVVFKPVVWDSVILTLNKGDIDVIWNGMAITEKRKEQINFSIPYLEGKDVYIVLAEAQINSKNDLKGKIIGVQTGSSQDESLKNDSFSKFYKEIKTYEDIKAALLDLQVKRVDAVFIDNFAGLYTAKELFKGNLKIREIDGENISTFSGVGLRKADKNLKNMIDKTIIEMKEDGTLSKIAKKWFGNDNLIVK